MEVGKGGLVTAALLPPSKSSMDLCFQVLPVFFRRGGGWTGQGGRSMGTLHLLFDGVGLQPQLETTEKDS